VAALVGAERIERLTSLTLSGNRIGPAGARALARWPGLTRLKWASLERNPFGPDGVDMVIRRAGGDLESKGPPEGFRLALGAMAVGDDGVARLTARGELRRCASLELPDNGITARGAWLLAASPAVNQLGKLELGSNPIGDEGAAALAASPHLRGLQELGLGSCGLTDTGVKALADSPHLRGLRELVIFDNALTDAAARALLHAPWPGLRTLHLSRRGLAKGAGVLEEHFGDKVKFY
jgi:Ran GTPase-activating protein (RanGAP) involved in mRNA processing and transport